MEEVVESEDGAYGLDKRRGLRVSVGVRCGWRIRGMLRGDGGRERREIARTLPDLTDEICYD
jgi:hypothetical protein